MDEVRSLVQEAVGEVRAEPDALERTMRRVRSRKRNRCAGAGATALVLAVLATWFVWRSFAAAPRTIPVAPEAGHIVFTTQGPSDMTPLIAVMEPDGSDVRVLARGVQPSWSPDGTMIAFSRYGPDRSAGIFVMNTDGSEVREVTSNPEGILDESPSWSPDGRSIVFSRNALDLSGPDPQPAGEARRDLYSVAVDGTGVTELIGGSTDDFDPDWSPDGSRIAFVRMVDPVAQGPRSTPQIWTVAADGTDVTQLMTFDRVAGGPDWSPDGSALAFDAGEDIFIVGADGEGLRRLEIPSGWGEEAESPNAPTWSPDGSRIAFGAGGEQGHDIFVVDVGGTNLERLTGPRGQDNEPSWVLPSDTSATGSASPTATVTLAASTACSESESSGDFDGDGSADRAKLYAVVPLPESDCGPESLEAGWEFELAVEMGSTTLTAPFGDCINPPDCQLLPGSDFDGDGRDELTVILSATSSSVSAIYRIAETDMHPLDVAARGDPGFLEPGPIRLGGHQTSIMSSGFECRIDDDGSRVLVAWSAERDDGVSPYRMHLTTLELDGDTFRVIATEDHQDVTALPPRHGICPTPSAAGSFGYGRLPIAPAVCPSGRFEPVPDAEGEIGNFTEQLLEAANGTSPDPARVWAIMDDSLKRLFGSYDEFATRIGRVSLAPEDTVWDIRAVHPPDLPFDAFGWVRQNCSEEIAAALTGTLWQVDVFWPDAKGLSAGVTHLFFVGRADGSRLWLVY